MDGAALKARAEAPPSAATAWYVLGVLLVIYTFNYIDRYLMAGLLEPIKAEFGVSDSFLGFLLGPAFAILFTTAAIPIARLADRASRVAIIAIGCAVWSGFTVLSGFARTGFEFALMRVGVGLGEAAFLAPAYSLLADYFPPRRRATAFAVLGLGLYFGQMGGLSSGPLIAAQSSWHWAFIIMGLPGIALAALLYLTVREPPRAQTAGAGAGSAQLPFLPVLRALWARRSYRWLILGGALGSFSGTGFGLWGPTYFHRVLGLSMTEANLAFAGAFGLCALVGMLGFGALCDRLSARDAAWPMRLSAISLLAATTCITLCSLAPSPTVALLLAVPSGLLGGGWSVGLLTAIQSLVPASIRATSTAIYSFALTFIGLVFGPMLVGVLSDRLAWAGVDSLRYALVIVISVGFPGAWLLLRGSRTLGADREPLAAAIDAGAAK